MSRLCLLLQFPFATSTTLVFLLVVRRTLHELAVLGMSTSVADLVLSADTALRGWHIHKPANTVSHDHDKLLGNEG